MIALAEWKDLILADERILQIGGSITFGSGAKVELTGSEIASVTIEEGSDGALSCGAVLSSICRVDLVNDEGQWNPGGKLLGGQLLIGATLMLKLGASKGNTTLWQDLGVFQIDHALCLESEALMRISCTDSISSELGDTFEDTLSYPLTLEGLWRGILSQTRYVWDGFVPNGQSIIDSKPDWNGASLRSAMGMTAAAAGCFVCIDRQGNLQLKPVVPMQEYILSGDHYLRLERDDASYGPIGALRLTPAGEDTAEVVYYANDDLTALHTLSVEHNPLFQKGAAHLDDLARGMLAAVADYQSEKAEFTWRGDPLLCVGDRILLTDCSGRRFSGILSRQTLSYKQSFSASCACLIPENADSGVRRAITPEGGLNAAALTGAVNGALLSVGSVTTNKLAAGCVTAEKIAAGAIDAQSLEAITAKIESLTAGDISADRLAAALAAFTVLSAGTAEFDRATVQHLVANALNLQFGVANEVFIKNLRVAYGQMVEATIGNLVIRASDGNYYRIDVDASGNVTSTPVALSGGEIENGQTDGGRIILATDITADSLNCSNLMATYALINRIEAARIDADELFANKAFIARLMTTDISSNSFIRQSIVNAATGQVAQFARLDEQGLHIGENGANSEMLIDENSASVVVGGRQYSSFASDFVQFGNYQLRRSADGGLVFKLTEE